MVAFFNSVGDAMNVVRTNLGMPGYGARDEWPPASVKPQWDLIRARRKRLRNDPDEVIDQNPHFSGAGEERKSTFTPVPLARDICRMSSQLLFSEDPRIVYEAAQDEIDEIISENELAAHLQDAGEKVAVEGVGALKVIRDDRYLEDVPIIAYVPGDQILWEIGHGRFIAAGTTVTTRRKNATDTEHYRLFTRHERGRIVRTLYKGTSTQVGQPVSLSAFEEFAGLKPVEPTVEGAITLIPWYNVPGGASDLAGLDRLLDRVDEGVSYGVSKLRKSDPVSFVDASLFSEDGTADTGGVIPVRKGMRDMEDDPAALTQTIQPGLQSEEHLAMVESFVNLAAEMAGYSRATWGRDQGGSADSGKALKIRLTRTLMTRAGKDRMTKAAITKALAIAYTWQHGGDVKDVQKEITVHLGDGLPEDTLETAQEIQALVGAQAVTFEDVVRRIDPTLSDEDVTKKARELEERYGGDAAGAPRSSVANAQALIEQAMNGSPNGDGNQDTAGEATPAAE